MEQYVLIIDKPKCTDAGRDPNAVELLQKMGLYGTVKTIEEYMAEVNAAHKKETDDLIAQIEAIKSQKLSTNEVALLNAVRAYTAKETQVHIDAKNALENQLKEISAENEKRNDAIAVLIGRKPLNQNSDNSCTGTAVVK